jgi:spore maturation protein CgeB
MTTPVVKILCVFGRHAYGDPARGEGYEHANFLPAFAALGHQVELFDSFDRQQYRDFADLNLRLIEHILVFQPDVIFCVLMGYEVWLETLDLIRSRSPAAVVNWGTDDSWKFSQFSRYLAEHVDLYVTTHVASLSEAAKFGIKNMMVSQWAAASSRLAEPLPSRVCVYDVSFVGAAYGNRRARVKAIARRGIDVTCFGHGWERGPVGSEDVDRIYRSSRVSLNFADSGLQLSGISLARSRQVKARTFEVPGAGGFLLSEESESLARYFRIGAEMITYRDDDEAATKIHYFLNHPDERDAIARAGHQRVRREHLYEARFAPILQRALEIAGERRKQPWTVNSDLLLKPVEKHRGGIALRRVLDSLRATGSEFAHRRLFWRALRRLTYEISWRLCGDRTFRATGFPGRFFYRES